MTAIFVHKKATKKQYYDRHWLLTFSFLLFTFHIIKNIFVFVKRIFKTSSVEEYSNLTMITLSDKIIKKKGLPIDG